MQEYDHKVDIISYAPHSNTRSAAEMIMLARYLGDRNTGVHLGQWNKSADGDHEIRGKTLGLVGY